MWKLIAAADKNWGIGKDNRLLVQIPGDMKHFREMTTGQIVVMGRRTLESFPGSLILPGRQNIVLTTNRNYSVKEGMVVHDVAELVSFLEKEEKEVYVIGGGSIYRQLLPFCDRAYITRINHAYDCDTYLPDLDQHEEWELISESEEYTYFDLEYVFAVYARKRGC